MLIELPNGDWIDPQTISAVLYGPKHEYENGTSTKDRLIITRYNSNTIIADCPDAETARKFQKQLAERVNPLPRTDQDIPVHFLKRLHELVWRNDDLMDQDTLNSLQVLIDNEILWAVNQNRCRVVQLANGHISSIEETR